MGIFGKHLTTDDIQRLEEGRDVQGLIQALTDPEVCEEAAQVLAKMMGAHDAKTVAQGFVNALTDENKYMRLEALATLELIARSSGAQVVVDAGGLSALQTAMEDSDDDVRKEARKTAERLEDLATLERLFDSQMKSYLSMENVLKQLMTMVNTGPAVLGGGAEEDAGRKASLEADIQKVLSIIGKLKFELERYRNQLGRKKISSFETVCAPPSKSPPSGSKENKKFKYCPKCGLKFTDKATPKFCSACGSKLR